MGQPGPDGNADVARYVAIRRLQAAYADVVSRRAWPELDALFARDCEIVVDRRSLPPLVLRGAFALGTFIADAIARFEFFEFTILNAVVDVDGSGDHAQGRLWMCELRQGRDGAGAPEWSMAYGVYHDEYARDAAGTWQFARRRYHSLARRLGLSPAGEVFPFPDHMVVEEPLDDVLEDHTP
jgi:hypothetical protein